MLVSNSVYSWGWPSNSDLLGSTTECWDYRQVQLYLVYAVLGIELRAGLHEMPHSCSDLPQHHTLLFISVLNSAYPNPTTSHANKPLVSMASFMLSPLKRSVSLQVVLHARILFLGGNYYQRDIFQTVCDKIARILWKLASETMPVFTFLTSKQRDFEYARLTSVTLSEKIVIIAWIIIKLDSMRWRPNLSLLWVESLNTNIFGKEAGSGSAASHLLGRLKHMNHKVQAVLQNEFKSTRATFGDPLWK